MDLQTQARIKELATQLGEANLVVVLGHLDAGGAGLAAETVTIGDPTYAGPLAGVPLGLLVYHVLEPDVKNQIPQTEYDAHLSLMELVLESDEPIRVTQELREKGSKYGIRYGDG